MSASAPVDQNAVSAPKQQNNTVQRPRSPSLENYRRVEKPREPTPDDEIRVTGMGRVGKYVSYAAKLFKEQEKTGVTIRATGKAISIAVSVCEVIKRRFKGLHQVTVIGWTDIIDEYEPLEEGLPPRSEKRTVPSITILLTQDESKVDKTAVGYQAPLDESLVEEREGADLTKPRPRQRRTTGRRPRGPKPEEGDATKTSPTEERPPRGDAPRGRGRRGPNNRRGPRPQQQQQEQQPQTEQAAAPVKAE